MLENLKTHGFPTGEDEREGFILNEYSEEGRILEATYLKETVMEINSRSCEQNRCYGHIIYSISICYV